MNVAYIQANLGDFDAEPQGQVAQDIAHDYFYYDDSNFPPRLNAMTPRLQARIVKMTMWQLHPDYDYYLWVDSSCVLSGSDSIQWFIDQLGDADMAVFKHPNRNTVQEEADYVQHRLDIGCPYITPRYAGERLKEQMEVVDPSAELYASTAFIMRNSTAAKDQMTIWWLHTSLYHSIDQLSLPQAIAHSGAKVNVIPDDYTKCDYISYVRKRK